ncbi:hypothetical protein PXD04_10320 [Methanosphaera sp. ISO3-F5]|uniref:hypothetical protein n=1 Tax=Methanosphaera sp. ISO3-F5 TaxID=1452353 RepID=UPI002B262A77|nr:hypothetical protein [Methanosphaera sp. ISO3-F5]WQH64085.1 hypothetical protein PXD04_10320 [Methanosphaera sp. ISO3-F5]
MNIVLNFNVEKQDNIITALRKTNKQFNKYMNSLQQPITIQGRGVSPHILKLFKE